MAPPHLVAQAILDGLDETARQMEQKWGVGRLRLLVDDALRAKFDAQKAKLDAAIATDQEVYVRAQLLATCVPSRLVRKNWSPVCAKRLPSASK
jgi:hypothetical protein